MGNQGQNQGPVGVVAKDGLDVRGGGGRDRRQELGPEDLDPGDRPPFRKEYRRGGSGDLCQGPVQVGWLDSSRTEDLPELLIRQVSPATQTLGGDPHGAGKGQGFQSVKGIVVDKGPHGPAFGNNLPREKNLAPEGHALVFRKGRRRQIRFHAAPFPGKRALSVAPPEGAR